MWKTQIRRSVVRFLAGLLFAVGGMAASTAEAQAPDDEISRVYFEHAKRVYESGNDDGALSLIGKSLEFDSDNSDAHFLRAKLLLTSQERTSEAVEALERSLSVGDFRTYRRYAAQSALAETLIRTTALDRAAEVLSGMAPADRTGSVAQRSYLEARLAAARGDRADAIERSIAMLSRYPGDARFLELVLTMRGQVGLRETRLLRRHRAQGMEGEYPESYRSAILWFMRKSEDPELVRQWGATYFELGGEDPLASVLLLENGADKEAELERFLSNGGDREQWLVRRAVAASDDASADLRRRLSDLTGELIDDRDRNGFYEVRYRFEEGRLRELGVDRDENGTMEHRIFYSENGEPIRADIESGQTVRYGDYPDVDAVHFADATYWIVPGRLELSILESPGEAVDGAPSPLGKMPQITAANVLTEELVRPLSFARELEQGEVSVVERLVDGDVTEQAADRDGDGAIDYYLEYRNGERYQAIRDMDNDGYFEATERYRNGELVEVAVDSDDNGRVDYLRRVEEGESRQWDYDEDGEFDTTVTESVAEAIRERLAVTLGIDDIVRIWGVAREKER